MFNPRTIVLSALVLLCVLATASCTATTDERPSKPSLTLSTTSVPSKGWVYVQGTGFTPNANVSSHLRRPNGTEFPVLPMFTNERGEIKHEIDTLLLDVGKHDLWIVDDTTKVSTDIVQFEITPN
jgi:hypothetical protein